VLSVVTCLYSRTTVYVVELATTVHCPRSTSIYVELRVLSLVWRRHTSINTCVVGVAGASLQRLIGATHSALAQFTPDSYYCLIDRLPAVSAAAYAARFGRRNGVVPGDSSCAVGMSARASAGAPPSLLSVEMCLALLRLSSFDPGVFLTVCYPLQRQLQRAPTTARLQVAAVSSVLCFSCTVLYCTVQYSTVQHNALRYSTDSAVQHSTLQCSTAQYSTVQSVLYCTVLYCTVLCCTVLYCTVLHAIQYTCCH
jgi:hypothetical protein